MLKPSIYGYFTDTSPNPTYDPMFTADCPICNKPLELPVKTISLMRENDNRSYFYRTHRDCYNNLAHEQEVELDSRLIDNIGLNVDLN